MEIVHFYYCTIYVFNDVDVLLIGNIIEVRLMLLLNNTVPPNIPARLKLRPSKIKLKLISFKYRRDLLLLHA